MWSYNIHFVLYIWFRTAVRRWSLFVPVFLNTQLRLGCFKESGEIEIKWRPRCVLSDFFCVHKYRFLSQNGYEFEFSTWPLTIQAPGVNNINSLRQFQYLIRQEKMLWELMKWSPGKLLWSLIKFSIQFLKEKYGEQSRDFSSQNLRCYLVFFS